MLEVSRMPGDRPEGEGGKQMLRWAILFLAAAMLAALPGFADMAGAFSNIAQFLFFVFLSVALLIFVLALLTERARF
jgi:uncharacterized membrane protein YtjA (UPF0391 family)